MLCSAAASAVAPAGIPDPDFGGVNGLPGFAVEAFEPEQNDQDRAYALVETVDDSLLLAGSVTGQGPSCIGLMRFDSSGVLDPTFGDGGKICHPQLLGLALQIQSGDFNAVGLSDGAVLVAGNAVDTEVFAFVCRFRADGTKDPGFGAAQTPGCRVLPHLISSSQKDVAPVIVANPDVIAIVSQPAHDDVPVVTRLAPVDGALMPYGQQNATPSLAASTFPAATVRDAAFTPDGDLLIAGAAWQGGAFDAYVSRFDMGAGIPDPAFGTSGAMLVDVGGSQSSAKSLRVLPTGETLMASVVQSPQGELAGLARIVTATGKSDPAFNGGKPSLFPVCQLAQCDIVDLQIDRSENGRLFLAGAIDVLSKQSIFAARVNPDGSPDAPYGPAPAKGIALFESKTVARAQMVLQGKNVVLGGTLALNQNSDFVLVRLGDEEIFADGFEAIP